LCWAAFVETSNWTSGFRGTGHGMSARIRNSSRNQSGVEKELSGPITGSGRNALGSDAKDQPWFSPTVLVSSLFACSSLAAFLSAPAILLKFGVLESTPKGDGTALRLVGSGLDSLDRLMLGLHGLDRGSSEVGEGAYILRAVGC
jgi:hypothetical protein